MVLKTSFSPVLARLRRNILKKFISWGKKPLKKWLKNCAKCGQKIAKKNGSVRGKNKFKCSSCFYHWVEQRGKRTNYLKTYKKWLCSRRTILEICLDLDVSYPKLIKEFDKLDASEGMRDSSLDDSFKATNLLMALLQIQSKS